MSSRTSGGSSHPSRRDNQSISSNHSSSSRSERSQRHAPHPYVESAVTRLLMSIKQLLESLTRWSEGKVDENHVSDVYVQLGNDFNGAVAAFGSFNIDMSELLDVPEDLRNVLEQCLAEEATPDNLNIYLPHVRKIITNLLQGLRSKQSIYRRIVSEHRKGSDSGSHGRSESRSSRGDRPSSRIEGSHRSHQSRSGVEGERVSRKSAHASGSAQDQPPMPTTSSAGDGQFVGGFAPGLIEQPTQQREPDTSPSVDKEAKQEEAKDTQSFVPLEESQSDPIGAQASDSVADQSVDSTPKPSYSHPAVPASVKRYSLIDKPVSPPAVVVEPSSPNSPDLTNGSSSPPPATPPLPEVPAAMANSLAALKRNDVLERRASKRYSYFNIAKMTGNLPSRDRPTRSNSNRRSLAASSALTQGELAVLAEVDEEPQPEQRVTKERSRTATPDGQDIPPVPRLPSPLEPAPEIVAAPGMDDMNEPSKITVFLQLGREVKKATIESKISSASLRVLFVDKFSYNPGLENFPAIYIRDPSSGVQYELEDTDEIKEKCLLSLNIEPLDQIKQHIDTQMSTLSQDIKELRSVVANLRHASPAVLTEPFAESTPPPATRPSDRQFQTVARRLSRFVGSSSAQPLLSEITSSPTIPHMLPQITGQSLQPQMTGGSILSDYSSRVVTDLKTQFDELQNLRRDLGIMRQLYTEFMKQTKDSLSALRTQTQSVKQLASTSVGGARGYIDSGKKKLDTRSQTVLTEVEKLLDTVEGMKDDVTKRQITPKEQYVKSVKQDIAKVATELESLKEHINTIKPMWKKTWEEELQNIVEEQQFLTHQEEFLNDLIEDHKAVVEVYGHIGKVISLRTPSLNGKGRLRTFKPPPPEEGHNGLSTVMLEIRGAAVDPEKRMKAIETNQRNREKERAAREEDWQTELSEFVGGKKLRMTGGADEAERVRQKRNEMTLKAMFAPSNTSSPMSMSSDLSSFGSTP